MHLTVSRGVITNEGALLGFGTAARRAKERFLEARPVVDCALR